MTTFDADDYASEISLFFMGKEYYERIGKGHLWVAHHDGFDTLVIEPDDHNQFEVAVRIPTKKNGQVFWAGYYWGQHGLRGVSTEGH
jgi:hypothetical protein